MVPLFPLLSVVVTHGEATSKWRLDSSRNSLLFCPQSLLLIFNAVREHRYSVWSLFRDEFSRATPNTPGSLEWLEARLIYERRHESSWHFPLGRRHPADRESPGAIWHLVIEWNRVSVSSSRPFFKKGLICSPWFPVMVRTDPDRCLIYHRLFR